MQLVARRKQSESLSKLFYQALDRVSFNLQATAAGGPIGGKGRKNDEAGSSDRACYLIDVFLPILGRNQEVKYGTIVPKVE